MSTDPRTELIKHWRAIANDAKPSPDDDRDLEVMARDRQYAETLNICAAELEALVLHESPPAEEAIRAACIAAGWEDEGSTLGLVVGVIEAWQYERTKAARGEAPLPAAPPATFQSCQCPAAPGEPCPLTIDKCHARGADYHGLPWFGARLRRIWEGFERESMNGVVCSIPDSGLNTPPHRRWCVRCQRRYMELKALVDMLDRPEAAPVASPSPP